MALTIQDAEILRSRVRPLVTAELIERARARPAPPYDPDIVEVMNFVRRTPDPDKPRYAIVQDAEGFAVAIRAAVAGEAPSILNGERFPDRGGAEHAVLERRLRDHGLTW